MAGRSKLLTLVESQVIEGYKNGMDLRELAALYDCSPGTIRNALIDNDIPLRPRGRKRKQGEPVRVEEEVE